MFPLGDDDSSVRSVTFVTYALIAANVLIFLLELSGGDEFIRQWAFVPRRFSEDPSGQAVTLLSAMFMHGGWMHLGGNMLYLWIFGNNVEDVFGPVKYLLFYLVSGLAATFAQYAIAPNSIIPNVGASGAIAGVLGAYLVMFPRQRINVAIGYTVMPMPALLVIGAWAALQAVNGVGSIANTDETGSHGGVAYMAHVGGFVAGLLLGAALKPRGPTRTA